MPPVVPFGDACHLVDKGGKRGRIVVPAELREQHGWSKGTTLVAVERSDGVLLMTLHEALQAARAQLEHADPVGDLFAERRRAALQEDGVSET